MVDPLITIVTAPKPFVDAHITTIQRNALRSWAALGDAVDVIVLGDDKGVQKNARALNVRYFSGVRCNEEGTPLISSMLDIARAHSQSPLLAIVNADIILFHDFLDAVRFVFEEMETFLLVGQRWDMQVTTEIQDAISFKTLQEQSKVKAVLHPPAGSDYFVFPRQCYKEIPDFAIGRAGWDNWFIYKSRFEGWKVIDGTHQVTIVHQDHDYRHLPGGQPHYRLPETKQNVVMGGGEHTIFTLYDAQYQLRNGKISKKKFTPRKVLREFEIFPLSHLKSHRLGKLFFYLFNPRKGYITLRSAVRDFFRGG